MSIQPSRNFRLAWSLPLDHQTAHQWRPGLHSLFHARRNRRMMPFVRRFAEMVVPAIQRKRLDRPAGCDQGEIGGQRATVHGSAFLVHGEVEVQLGVVLGGNGIGVVRVESQLGSVPGDAAADPVHAGISGAAAGLAIDHLIVHALPGECHGVAERDRGSALRRGRVHRLYAGAFLVDRCRRAGDRTEKRCRAHHEIFVHRYFPCLMPVFCRRMNFNTHSPCKSYCCWKYAVPPSSLEPARLTGWLSANWNPWATPGAGTPTPNTAKSKIRQAGQMPMVTVPMP